MSIFNWTTKSPEEKLITVRETESGNPLICFLDGPQGYLEELFSKGPEKTFYAENALTGAAYNELEQLPQIDEKTIKMVFPRATATTLVDPLKRVDKIRIHDNIRRDGSTFMANWLLNIFTLGAETTITLGLSKKYANKEREDAALTEINAHPEYLDVLEDLMNRDELVDLHSRSIEILFNGSAFGRSVQIQQRGADGFPCGLVPLSSPRLGRVWVDKFNYQFLGVEYLDYRAGKNILLAKDIIHYEENDFSITPNSRFYGMAMSESSIAIGERNRAGNEIALPEIMKRYFAPLMKVSTKTNSQRKLDQIRDAWKSGKILFINEDITVDVIPVETNIEKVRDTITEGAKAIYNSFSVPPGLASPDLQNKATMEGTLLSWYDGPINYRRKRFDSVLWYQWYKPQLEKMEQDKAFMAMQGGVIDYLRQRMENPRITLPFRITTEFTNIRTVGFLDSAAALAQFGDRKYLMPWMIREESGLGKYNDEMATEEMKAQPLANNLLTTEQNMMNQPQSQPPPGGGGFGVGGVPDLSSQSSFANKMSSRTGLPSSQQ